ncbi:MAG: superoxide dismutase, partial [Candidatus Dormibacteraceae bacterium]
PHIDQPTMKLHHDIHHQAYVDKLNAAVSRYPQMANVKVEDLLINLNSLPAGIRTAVRENGGQHLNHSIFWTVMAPKAGGQPEGNLATAINGTFASFDAFKKIFAKAATDQFGSGWVWLYLDRQGKLVIGRFANGDNPIMMGGSSLLGLDVWEHAYYLKYQNKRMDYITAWWNVVNWKEVNSRFTASIAPPRTANKAVANGADESDPITGLGFPGLEIIFGP